MGPRREELGPVRGQWRAARPRTPAKLSLQQPQPGGEPIPQPATQPPNQPFQQSHGWLVWVEPRQIACNRASADDRPTVWVRLVQPTARASAVAR